MKLIIKTAGLSILTFILFVCFCTLSIIIGDGINTLSHGIIINNHVNGNNLSVPLPNTDTRTSYVPYKHIREVEYEKYIHLPLENFTKVIQENYYYDDMYNCQYWSFIWTLYWQEHRNETKWKLEYVDTDNHVFVMVYNDTGYCILDQTEVNCLYENG